MNPQGIYPSNKTFDPFIAALVEFFSMEFFSDTFQVVSVASFNSGDNLDLIPDSATLGGTFRAFSNTSFYQLRRRIEQVSGQTGHLCRQ